MDRFKFKAWDLKRKKMGWVENLQCDYRNDTKNDDWICYSTDEMQIKERQCGDYREKQNVILLQCTGLEDKNGKEIYAGDIYLTYTKDGELFNEEKDVVEWEEGCYGIGWGLFPSAFDYEVVGDIYTTPELLNKGEK